MKKNGKGKILYIEHEEMQLNQYSTREVTDYWI